jgi:hypothetical protein
MTVSTPLVSGMLVSPLSVEPSEVCVGEVGGGCGGGDVLTVGLGGGMGEVEGVFLLGLRMSGGGGGLGCFA